MCRQSRCSLRTFNMPLLVMRPAKIQSASADYWSSLRSLDVSMNLFGIFLEKPGGIWKYPALFFTWLTFFAHLAIGAYYFQTIVRKTTLGTGGFISYVLDNLSYNLSIAAIHWLLIVKAGPISALHAKMAELDALSEKNRGQIRFRTYSALVLSFISVEVNYILSIITKETEAHIGLSVMQKYFYPSFAFALFCISTLTLAAHLDQLRAHLADSVRLDADQLEWLQKKHFSLMQIKGDIADCFGSFLLIGIADLFVRLISFSFYTVTAVQLFSTNPLASQVWTLFCYVECFFRLFVVCYAADKLHTQVRILTNQLLDVQLRLSSQPELATKMQAFVLQALTVNNEITAGGYFTVNKRVIVALISTTITYTIVLLQLPKQ